MTAGDIGAALVEHAETCPLIHLTVEHELAEAQARMPATISGWDVAAWTVLGASSAFWYVVVVANELPWVLRLGVLGTAVGAAISIRSAHGKLRAFYLLGHGEGSRRTAERLERSLDHLHFDD